MLKKNGLGVNDGLLAFASCARPTSETVSLNLTKSFSQAVRIFMALPSNDARKKMKNACGE
jgi:hypothetical protein